MNLCRLSYARRGLGRDLNMPVYDLDRSCEYRLLYYSLQDRKRLRLQAISNRHWISFHNRTEPNPDIFTFTRPSSQFIRKSLHRRSTEGEVRMGSHHTAMVPAGLMKPLLKEMTMDDELNSMDPSPTTFWKSSTWKILFTAAWSSPIPIFRASGFATPCTFKVFWAQSILFITIQYCGWLRHRERSNYVSSNKDLTSDRHRSIPQHTHSAPHFWHLTIPYPAHSRDGLYELSGVSRHAVLSKMEGSKKNRVESAILQTACTD